MNKIFAFLAELFFPAADRCPVCGKEGGFCETCRSQLRELRTGEDAAFYYGGIVKTMIHRLKFRDKAYLAKIMGELMAEELCAEGDVVTAVPLHKKRRRQRGYNQSRLIAETYAELKGLPYEDLLVRVRNTPPQSLLTKRDDRQKNISGAFLPREGSSITGKRILLVDDVVTTGATIGECRTELIKAGAAAVITISFARGKGYGNSENIAETGTGKRSDV